MCRASRAPLSPNSFEITGDEKKFLAEKNIQIDLPTSASGKLVIEDTDILPNIIGTLLEKINTEDKPAFYPLENIVCNVPSIAGFNELINWC